MEAGASHLRCRRVPISIERLAAFPILEVDARRLVVLWCQAAIDIDDNVLGDVIETQTEATLGNCARLLADGTVSG